MHGLPKRTGLIAQFTTTAHSVCCFFNSEITAMAPMVPSKRLLQLFLLGSSKDRRNLESTHVGKRTFPLNYYKSSILKYKFLNNMVEMECIF